MERIHQMYMSNNKKKKSSMNIPPQSLSYKMFRLYQYNFFNKIPNKILHQKFHREKVSIFKLIIVSLLLFAFYVGLLFYIMVFLMEIYTNYQFYIVKVWLLPSLIQLILVRFVVSYVMNFLNSILLFGFFAKKKTNKIIKLLYLIFIPKYVRYIYRIRNYVTKYHDMIIDVWKKYKNNELQKN
jgi:hypothetical protein